VNKYTELKARQQAEVEAFPMFFAFSKEQFAEGMAKLGLQPDEYDKIGTLAHTGGYILKTDSDMLFAMFDRHDEEMQAAVNADETGEGFIFDMFSYELENHEYNYTRSYDSTLEALGLDYDEIQDNAALRHGLLLASKALEKHDCF